MRYDELQDEIKNAMRAKDKPKLSILRQVHGEIKNIEVNERRDITDADVDAMLKRLIKQTKETMETAPADREDIKSEAAARLAVYEEFAPADLTEDQIRQVIAEVLAELGIEEPKKSDKGAIMKILMPKVKGKADGKAVNEILAGMLK